MRYVRYMYMRAAVRGLLEERLDRINANASRAATYLARAGLRSSRHRVDGGEDDAMIQHERAVKF